MLRRLMTKNGVLAHSILWILTSAMIFIYSYTDGEASSFVANRGTTQQTLLINASSNSKRNNDGKSYIYGEVLRSFVFRFNTSDLYNATLAASTPGAETIGKPRFFEKINPTRAVLFETRAPNGEMLVFSATDTPNGTQNVYSLGRPLLSFDLKTTSNQQKILAFGVKITDHMLPIDLVKIENDGRVKVIGSVTVEELTETVPAGRYQKLNRR